MKMNHNFNYDNETNNYKRLPHRDKRKNIIGEIML